MIPTGKKITLKSKSKQKNINGNAINVTNVSSGTNNFKVKRVGLLGSSTTITSTDFKNTPIVKGPNEELIIQWDMTYNSDGTVTAKIPKITKRKITFLDRLKDNLSWRIYHKYFSRKFAYCECKECRKCR